MSSVFDSEGINPDNNYTFSIIKRVEDNYKLADTGLQSSINTLTSNISTLTTDFSTLTNLVNTNRITINVKDYGAIGNGTTDDTTAINNAMNAVPADGGILYFSQGKYKITNTITIQNKTNLLVKCDDAYILCYTNAVGFVYFNNCQHTEIEGCLTIACNTPALSSYGIVVNNCQLSFFKNIFISGDFAIGLYANTNSSENCCQFRITVKGCRNGIRIQGEYYELCNCNVSNCYYGVDIYGGNSQITGGNYNYNKIGVRVFGGLFANSDHGRIVGATLNHNDACGIFCKNLILSYSIVGCQIWAMIGQYTGGTTLTEAGAVSARTGSYGIYLQNCVNVNISGCHIARNSNNIGLDGWCLCNITGNSFMSDTLRTVAHIIEYGEANTIYSINAQNIIANNVFDGNTNSSNKRIAFLDTYNGASTKVINNVGTTDFNMLYIYGSATFYLGQHDDYIVNYPLTIVPFGDSGYLQITNMYIISAMFGLSFSISIIQSDNIKSLNIRFRTNSGITPSIGTNSSSKCVYYVATKSLTITGVERLTFTPYSSAPMSWNITAT
jgi:hypothetical protein